MAPPYWLHHSRWPDMPARTAGSRYHRRYRWSTSARARHSPPRRCWVAPPARAHRACCSPQAAPPVLTPPGVAPASARVRCARSRRHGSAPAPASPPPHQLHTPISHVCGHRCRCYNTLGSDKEHGHAHLPPATCRGGRAGDPATRARAKSAAGPPCAVAGRIPRRPATTAQRFAHARRIPAPPAALPPIRTLRRPYRPSVTAPLPPLGDGDGE